MVLNIIRQTIREYNLLNEGDKVLAGLSGGADSVCLTHALYTLREELGVELYTAHLNHGIRGAEAERDSQFAVSFSKELGLKCFVEKADIPSLAKNSGQSEETAARQARYAFFEQISQKYGINKIATAHNKNDNAETIVMNFMRGGSLSGLSGIPHKRDNIVRPLLNVSREDIEKYCADNDLNFVTDSTNLTNDYTRNKIRHLLIPTIEKEFNPNFIETMTENARLICDDNSALNKYAVNACTTVLQDNTADITLLHTYDKAIQRRIIRMFLKDFYGTLNGISSQFVNDVLSLSEKHSGKSINLPNEAVVRNEYGKLIIERGNSNVMPFEYTVQIGKEFVIDELKKLVKVTLSDSRRSDGAVYLAASDKDSIIIRSRKSGDKFCPSGMEGTKKVKEYLINSKIPREIRDTIPIIEINGEIAAVGKRVDERCLFKDKGIRIEFKDI